MALVLLVIRERTGTMPEQHPPHVSCPEVSRLTVGDDLCLIRLRPLIHLEAFDWRGVAQPGVKPSCPSSEPPSPVSDSAQ